jgi:hypothetical protein
MSPTLLVAFTLFVACPLLPIKLSHVSSRLTHNFTPPYLHCEKYPLLVYKVSRQFFS